MVNSINDKIFQIKWNYRLLQCFLYVQGRVFRDNYEGLSRYLKYNKQAGRNPTLPKIKK
jgi:hypothetical protein